MPLAVTYIYIHKILMKFKKKHRKVITKWGVRLNVLTISFSNTNRLTTITDTIFNLPDNLPDKASPGETGSASRVTQTEIVYKVTHLYNVFPIAAW